MHIHMYIHVHTDAHTHAHAHIYTYVYIHLGLAAITAPITLSYHASADCSREGDKMSTRSLNDIKFYLSDNRTTRQHDFHT